MENTEELINLLISAIFFIYLIIFVGHDKKPVKRIWFYGIIFLMLSRIATVLEAYFLPQTLNITEHVALALGCILFLISVLKKEL